MGAFWGDMEKNFNFFRENVWWFGVRGYICA
jgi:hypothetical protein